MSSSDLLHQRRDIPTGVLVTSTFPDRLNTNAMIRHYLHEAFAEEIGAERVAGCPLELAAANIEALRPNLVIAVGSLASDASDLRRLRRAADTSRSILAFWLHDDPYEFDYAYKAEFCADVVFSNDAWSVLHYRHPNVHHLPMAAAPRFHWRPFRPIEDRDLALFFCGVAFPNRVDLLRRADDVLCRRPVAVLGADWPGDIRCAQNRRLSVGEMADHAQRSRLTLNIGRELNIANRRYALPASTPGPRTFEIAQSGSAQLYFAAGLEITDYFEPETEIILVDGVRDIERAIERAYDDPAGIGDIASRAQQRALEEHSYRNRAQRILSICAVDPGE
ncbi:MAG TPA: glycosyltransferase [Bradyrhizobium sp.]|jgi:spore maturation protein CgeB|nr:glycosyltransferase [Bradyrhizobium sp.]